MTTPPRSTTASTAEHTPVSAVTLAHIKEKTRGLHQLKRRTRESTPTHTPAPLSPSTTQSSFSVVLPFAISTSRAADEAIARLRQYTEEQRLLHTADDWRQQAALRAALRLWRAHHQAHREEHIAGLRLRGRLRLRRLRTAVDEWSGFAREARQSVARRSPVLHFFARHALRRCFSAWVGYALERKRKEAAATLASYMHRSTALRRAFHLWLHCTYTAQLQSGLQQQAAQFHAHRLLSDAWVVWVHERHVCARERERERSASAVGDDVRRRYYLRQWRRLGSRVTADEEIGSTLERIEERRRLLHAWTTWKDERRWRIQSQQRMEAFERARLVSTVRAAIEQWQRAVGDRRERVRRRQTAREWRTATQRRSSLEQWAEAVRETRIVRATEARQQRNLSASLLHWSLWTQRRHQRAVSDRHHRRHVQAAALRSWQLACAQIRAQRHMLDVAHHHWRGQQLTRSVEHWLFVAAQRRGHRSDLALAVSHHYRQQARSAVRALAQHSRIRLRTQQQMADARRSRLHAAVALLREHARAGRIAWQHFLAAKRHRYLHLLRFTLSCWRKAVLAERHAEDNLMRQRCGGLLRAQLGELFGLWKAQLRQRVLDREREGEALAAWRRVLLQRAWVEWECAMQDRGVEKQRAAVADGWWALHHRWMAIRSWAGFVQARRRSRQRDADTVDDARRALRAHATRRHWRQLLQRFHESRLTRLSLQRAVDHQQRHRRIRAIAQWRTVTALRKRSTQLGQVASRVYAVHVMSAAWTKWQRLFAERRRLLALHLKARDWRRVREERRVWRGWAQWVESRRGLRRREEEMRRLRIDKLRVEGCRQWITVGLDWLQQEKEADRAVKAEDERRRNDARHQRLQGAVEQWVRRIAHHWRRLRARRGDGNKAEVLRALLPPDIRERWRAAAESRAVGRSASVRQASGRPLTPAPSAVGTDPQSPLRPFAVPSSPAAWASGVFGQSARREEDRSELTLAALSSSTSSFSAAPPTPFRSRPLAAAGPSSTSFASFAPSAAPLHQRPRAGRERTQPRRNVELLLPLDSSNGLGPAPLSLPPSTSVRSATVHGPALPSFSFRQLPRSHPSAAASCTSARAQSSSSTAAVTAADVAAMESRMQFLSAQRSQYRANSAELMELQKRLREEGEQLPHAVAAALRARCGRLSATCVEFEQQKVRWKAEVIAWQDCITSAQTTYSEESVDSAPPIKESPAEVRGTSGALLTV